MSEERLPDCRCPRPDRSLTSASAHPELLCGDFFPRRPHVDALLSPAERVVYRRWSLRTIGLIALILIGLLALPVFKAKADNIPGATMVAQAYLSCAPWNAAASEVIVRLTHNAAIDLRSLTSAVATMRRARRLCDLGLVGLACLEYEAIVLSVPSSPPREPPQMCLSAVVEPSSDHLTRQ